MVNSKNVFVSLVISLMVAIPAFAQLSVKTDKGVVVGHYNEAGIREWKGIPYAQPPVGNLRWADPQEPGSFNGEFVANVNVNGCPQTCNLPPGNCPAYGMSEDCLYLTVMAPAKPSADPAGYPVLFWVHGGAFEQGLGNCALYNGTYFAQKDVVTVAINYRLGALGFMAATNMGGNYGLKDQRLALQWTQKNIAAFGGDPNKVAVAGQSAGAMSTAAHMVSPLSKGLFSRAVMESNPLALPFHTRESAGSNADSIMTYLGCAVQDVACMRTKSVDQVLDAQKNAVKLDLNTLLVNFLPFAPMVDGVDIPKQPFDALAAGEFSSVPLLAGSVVDEGQLFVFELFPKALSSAEYKLIIQGVFGSKSANQILAKYPFEIYPGNKDGRNTLNVLATDLLFLCPLRNVSRGSEAVQAQASNPTFIYRFKHILSFDAWGENYTFCVGEVCHGSELPFVFKVFNDGDSIFYDPTAAELTLSEDLLSAWTNFITSGNPNTGLTLPVAYPRYESGSDPLIVLEEPGSYTDSRVRDEYCNMWDKLGYYY